MFAILKSVVAGRHRYISYAIPVAVLRMYEIFQRYDTRLVGRTVTRRRHRERAARIPSFVLSSIADNYHTQSIPYRCTKRSGKIFYKVFLKTQNRGNNKKRKKNVK